MGAWGASNFANDTALDWVWDLKESNDLSPVEGAIADVLNCSDDLDADLGCIGLAAAEVVAALRNKPVDDLPEDVYAWVARHRFSPSERLVKDCLAAIDKVRNDEISELRELWEEDEDPPTEWYSVVDDLAARLR